MVNCQTQTLIVNFRIWGNLRFLSHRETTTMLQRGLVRAGIELCYSQGFNPRPKMSLPLPRSVGVASDAEVLSVSVCFGGEADAGDIQDRIQSQMPDGCEIVSVTVVDGKAKYHPAAAVYSMGLRETAINESFRAKFDVLEKSCGGKEELIVNRQKARQSRQVDVSGYIDGLKMEDEKLIVNCLITQKGSVRLDEILQLLGLEAKDLCSPIKRVSVEWTN